MTDSVTPLHLHFDEQQIIKCLPNEINTPEFAKHSQLALTHSANCDSWYDGVGSLYDFQNHKFIDSTDSFTVLNKFFEGTYIEHVVNAVKLAASDEGVSIGRIRYMVLNPKTCYTLHKDPEDFRYHIPLVTNKNNFFVVDTQIFHMSSLGHLYRFKTKEMHTAVNASRHARSHIVFDTY